MKTVYLLPVLLVVLLACKGCTGDQSPEEEATGPDRALPEEFQTVSLLGDSLYVQPIEKEGEGQYEQQLQRARREYEEKPGNANAIIKYGRQLAYAGLFRQAIEIYSEGIEEHPEDARLYRHRGHRHITLRNFDEAIDDLEQAVFYIRGTEDVAESNIHPNEQDIPRGTLHFNSWYHLGLAYYLDGDLRNAERAYRECLQESRDDDLLVATSYWLYLTLMQQGKETEAYEILEPITDGLEVIENEHYYRLLLMFKEEINPEIVIKRSDNTFNEATMGYGIAWWYRFKDMEQEAIQQFEQVLEGRDWHTFGYIAAEVELALKETEDW